MLLDLQSIMNEWEIDSEIPQHKLDDVSRETPKLHAKYLQQLGLAKLQAKRESHRQKILLKQKWLYYNGKMDEAELRESGWKPDPFNGLKILKGEMDYYYDADPEIQASEEKAEYWKVVISTLTDIVSSLAWRHQTVGNIIKWRAFEAGG
tara:strand:- start:44939 stop:45388 length:450 start_codon:yes stop_codon:yes gene_type:complete